MPQCIPTHPIDPRIGVLMRNGAPVFYAFIHGNGKDHLEGTLNEIEQALGVPLSPCSCTNSEVAPASEPYQPSWGSNTGLRRYVVTIVPSVVLYGAGGAIGTREEYVDARNKQEAVREVRQRLREVNDRHDPKYNVTARLDEG